MYHQSSYHCGLLEFNANEETLGASVEHASQSHLFQGWGSWGIYMPIPVAHGLNDVSGGH